MKEKKKKERLDVLLVKRGLAESREKAKAIIMTGNVFVEEQREDKAGSTFAEDPHQGNADEVCQPRRI